jgi:antagonist of KipI
MGISILKAGIADSLQDQGRYGFQHLGIPPGGAMDPVAMLVSNALVGNQKNEAVIEMHFPCSIILFTSSALIALAGADFGAEIDGVAVELHQPILVPQNSELRFTKNKSGARVYLSVAGGFVAEEWLGSFSTMPLVQKGGFKGRNLATNDCLIFKKNQVEKIESLMALPWRANVAEFYFGNRIQCIAGAEATALNEEATINFKQAVFSIGIQSNRMGYRLNGPNLNTITQKEYLSSAVDFGTIQLLPNGQLIVLMADHQTTGGYPRIAHVSSTYFATLAQSPIGKQLEFEWMDIATAEKKLLEQQQNLQQLQNACNFRLQEYFSND